MKKTFNTEWIIPSSRIIQKFPSPLGDLAQRNSYTKNQCRKWACLYMKKKNGLDLSCKMFYMLIQKHPPADLKIVRDPECLPFPQHIYDDLKTSLQCILHHSLVSHGKEVREQYQAFQLTKPSASSAKVQKQTFIWKIFMYCEQLRCLKKAQSERVMNTKPRKLW